MIAMSFAVIFASLGEISLSKGMKAIDAADYPSLYATTLATVTNIHVISGIALLSGFLVLYLISLSWEDLSFVLPLTGAVFVLVTILAYFVLHEDVTPLRWAGSVLVAFGIALVSRS